jgi:NAD+ synthase
MPDGFVWTECDYGTIEGIDVKAAIQSIVDWLTAIKKSGCKGVSLGLSGGKDSTVVAMLAVKVWGRENVHGIIMPNHNWDDVEDALAIARALRIKYFIKPIKETYDALTKYLTEDIKAFTNVAPRIRMTVLYAMAQAHGHRVIGTGNRSERYIGWCTKFGDMGCDMNPIAHLTCGQVIEIGMELARDYDIMLDTKYIQRPPADGLTGKTDEDNFGFTYDQLDAYILNGTSGNKKIDKKIEKMHEAALHKLTMPATMEMEGL